MYESIYNENKPTFLMKAMSSTNRRFRRNTRGISIKHKLKANFIKNKYRKIKIKN